MLRRAGSRRIADGIVLLGVITRREWIRTAGTVMLLAALLAILGDELRYLIKVWTVRAQVELTGFIPLSSWAFWLSILALAASLVRPAQLVAEER